MTIPDPQATTTLLWQAPADDPTAVPLSLRIYASEGGALLRTVEWDLVLDNYAATFPSLPSGTYWQRLGFQGMYGADSQDGQLVLPLNTESGLTSLAEAKTYLGITSTQNDSELRRLVAAADRQVQNHAGPTLIRSSFTDRVIAAGGRALLPHWPVTAVTTVRQVAGGGSVYGTYDSSQYDGTGTGSLCRPDIGEVYCPVSGLVEVTYTAGLPEVPPEAEQAALEVVAYKYRRNHGGTPSFQPAGTDAQIAAPMGVTALEQQIELTLGEYARGPVVG